jgi:NUBPL iron-transfer P-loop NTPase
MDDAVIFGHGSARREDERFGTEFLGEVPLDLKIRETSDGGTPITVPEPDNPYAKLAKLEQSGYTFCVLPSDLVSLGSLQMDIGVEPKELQLCTLLP